MELLAPAGSPEALEAAVRSGADAVYLGFGEFNARRGARNFGEDPKEAIDFCHKNGVKVYVTLNTLVSDRESGDFLEYAKRASRLGADAALVQDIGMARLIKRTLPDLPLHASTQMSIHDLAGAELCAKMGFERVVLARELPIEQIRYICRNSPVEVETFVHGALCMCYSGQCYMSAVIGERSGNRGRCAQPCRMPFGAEKRDGEYALSLKDVCYADHLKELEEAGVAALKIEGRMKRPEYVAVVTSTYKKLMTTGAAPSRRDMRNLTTAFSRGGFTDGYLTGRREDMFGVRTENEDTPEYRDLMRLTGDELTRAARGPGRVAVDMAFEARIGRPCRLLVRDADGNEAAFAGETVQRGESRVTDVAAAQTQLGRLGGTAYRLRMLETSIDDGALVGRSTLNELRRRAVSRLDEMRCALPDRRENEPDRLARHINIDTAPDITIEVPDYSFLTDEVIYLAPRRVYMPIEELCSDPARFERARRKNIDLCPKLPRVIWDGEQRGEISRLLDTAARLGADSALCTNLGQIQLIREHGLFIRGDYGLNIYNSQSVMRLLEWGFKSAALSFELTVPAIADIAKYIPCEAIFYGRLPLMYTENCVVPGSSDGCGKCRPVFYMYDRRGEKFAVRRGYGCRNEILNAHYLWLCDRLHDFAGLGLTALRLIFTDEDPRRAARVMEAALTGVGQRPAKFTRGLYYKGV